MQPVLRVAVELRRDERPQPLEPLAVQAHGQPAVLFSSTSSYVPRSQISTVPGAVLALRDLALEGRVVERVVLDVDGERALARLERHALRHRPARERAVALEPEVVVEPPRVVPLDDEDRPLPARLPRRAGRLRRRRRGIGSGVRCGVALAPVVAVRSRFGTSLLRRRISSCKPYRSSVQNAC